MTDATPLTGFLQRFVKSDRGGVLIMTAFGLAFILVAIAVSVEMGHYTREKARLRNATDQALIAVASRGLKSEEQADSYGRRVFLANLPERGKGLIDPQIKLTPNNAEASSWSAEATAKMPTSFAGILGIGSMDMKHKTSVAWDESVTNEVVAIVDVSGTMCARFTDLDSDNKFEMRADNGKCEKLVAMEKALKGIVDVGVSSAQANFNVGLVPFTYKVKLPHPNKVATVAPFLMKEELNSDLGDKSYYTDFGDVEQNGGELPQVWGLQNISSQADKNLYKQQVEKLVSNNGAAYHQEADRYGWKRSSLGAQIAGLMLDPEYKSLFDGKTPRPFGAARTRKVVILMTDSVNMGCCFTNWPEDNFEGNYTYSYRPDHQQLVGGNGKTGICQLLKKAGVEIYTVLFDVKAMNASARGREIIDAFKTCATNDSDEPVPGQIQIPTHFFPIYMDDANYQDQLEEAYQQIGRSLINLRLQR